MRFLCRKPLAERLSVFVEHRCMRFLCRKPLAEILHTIAEPLSANAERLYEADERIAEESCGHREFARMPKPWPRTLDARGERPPVRVGSVHK